MSHDTDNDGQFGHAMGNLKPSPDKKSAFDAEKFYTEFRNGMYGEGWQRDETTSHEHVEALEATVSAALNVAWTNRSSKASFYCAGDGCETQCPGCEWSDEAKPESTPSASASSSAMERIRPDVHKIRNAEALDILGQIMAYVSTDQRIRDLIEKRIAERQ